MSNRMRMSLSMTMLAAMLCLASYSQAQPDQAIEKAIIDIAGEFKAGKSDAARQKAIVAARKIEDPGDVMRLFDSPNQNGLGLGAKLRKLPNAKAAEDLARKVAAIAELTRAMPPKKLRQAWIADADNLRSAGLDLAKAAAKNDLNGMKAAAEKANAACANCHSVFKK